jgi:hypothetical protein
MLEWAKACGVTHWKALLAIERRLLTIPPRGVYVDLDESAAQLAVSVVPTERALAYNFFRCLQRVAAFQWRGNVSWPSAWLRGARSSPIAITGASGYSGELTALLKQHVLSLVEGHCAGKRSATYGVKVPIRRGPIGVKEFASRVGVRIDDRGAPQGFV